MKRAKPIRAFEVRVQHGGVQTIEGETFFAARAAFLIESVGHEPPVEADDVRLAEHRRLAS